MIAFVFPGQGSQQPGMGAPWADHPSFELVEEASNILDRDLTHLLTDADSDMLQITRNTQISTFLLSMVALDAVERLGVAPQVCAGHSLGEYAALVAAGGLAFDAGLRLVQERGEAMAIAAEAQPGAMIALLGADLDVARAMCDSIPGDLWVANHNSASQIVLSGTHETIAQVEARAKEFGVKRVTRLKVGGAFHSPYMEAARDRLFKAIEATKFYDLEVPVIANVDAREHVEAADWPALLADQLTHSVRWEETIQYLRELKPRLVLEVGPGGVLTNLMKRTAPELSVLSIATPADLEKLLATVASQGPMDDWATSHQGERLYGTERLVVAPSTGVFQPEGTNCVVGDPIFVGQLLGTIGETELRSPFAGVLQGMIAVSGERVTTGQPIAWLTISDQTTAER
ncbi:ACP S-malonyltransferase [Ferrimicrobium sp.]|uniref:ACP S-malonyltransferase n=1 Tax=Ferrimicrobium sp. TaxID=2926050 RepID=UPI002622F6C5|nr:ACP S-malonyltransferase [Ferrimicrobium sp.]